jgi:transposase-like protein
MTTISPNLLNDTLNLVALARETALSRGEQAKAQRLGPVVENLRSVAVEAQKTRPDPAGSELLGQSDFQTLLAAMQKQPVNGAASPSPAERNQVVTAMASGGMAHVDIARQMGITREEVRMILSVTQASGTSTATQPAAQNLSSAEVGGEAAPRAAVAALSRRINEAYGRWQK